MSYFFKIAKKAKYFLPTSPHVPFKCCFSCHTKLNPCMEFGKNLDFCIRMFFLKTLSFQACFWKKLIRAFMIFSWYCLSYSYSPHTKQPQGGTESTFLTCKLFHFCFPLYPLRLRQRSLRDLACRLPYSWLFVQCSISYFHDDPSRVILHI